MKMYKFFDREKELEYLNSEYSKKESSLIVLYGRRRIGKTSLIKEFGKNKNMIYLLLHRTGRGPVRKEKTYERSGKRRDGQHYFSDR